MNRAALPGYPSETASGKVKAPQYFALGVAGDHGEPIAKTIRIGGFLFPNNLPANAHGNAMPIRMLLIPNTIKPGDSSDAAFRNKSNPRGAKIIDRTAQP